MTPWKRPPRQGFTLIELLVVMAIIVVMISLGAKVINSVTGNQSLGQINSTVADILNDARNQAMARNTYVWVGFANVTDSYSSKLTLAAVESVTGQASDLSANPPVTKVVMPLRSFVGVGIDSTLSIPGMNPSSVDISSGTQSGANPMSFTVRQTTFNQVIQFDPQGQAMCQSTLSPWINVKLHQSVGNRRNLAAVQVSGTTGAILLFRP